MSSWIPPAAFDEYRLVRPLGQGGMGQVYLGHDVLLDRLVAVKFIAAVQPDEEKRRRFLLEGRVVARLAHPNVVAIYRVGEVEGRPYFVAEFVRGQGLDALPKPLPWQKAQQIALGLARGLAAAHRQGVLHRDIKPANAMLAEDGEVKLLDFGLAKLLADRSQEAAGTQTTVSLHERTPPKSGEAAMPVPPAPSGLFGTPRYMAPEILGGAPATCRSDVYSLGAVLYELCSGQPPARTGGERAPLAPGPGGVESRLAAIVDRCLEIDPTHRFASADELLDALAELTPVHRSQPIVQGNPYRGLRPFEAEHRSLFFGREPEIRAVLERLRAERLVIVAGDSGVGKSSLCRAGVLPLVIEGALQEGRGYSSSLLIPGRRPIAALAAALGPALGLEEDALVAWLRSDPGALGRALGQNWQKRSAGTILFIDQLEELLTLSEPSETALLSEALGLLARSAIGIRVLATVRGDFFTRLGSLPGLGPEVSRALYLLRPLSADRIRDAIVGPAQRKGFRFESEEMVSELVESATTPGGLPLLQFALAELWEARDQERRQMPASALAAMGGVAGALARHADGVLGQLAPEQRAAATRILVRLVTIEGTNARRSADELVDPASGEVLETLVRARLVVAREVEGKTVYELAHEALIRSWSTLRGWLEASGDRRQVRHRVEAAAAEWARLGRAREALWRERQLAESARLDPAELGGLETDFLRASRSATRRSRIWRGIGYALAPLAIFFVFAGARVRTRLDLDRRVEALLRSADADLVRGRQADQLGLKQRRAAFVLFDSRLTLWHPDQQRRAMAIRLDGQAERNWAAALELEQEAEASYARAAGPIEAALLLAPGREQIRRSLAELTVARILLATRARALGHRAELMQRLKNYDSAGGTWRSLEAPARVHMATDPPGARAILQRFEDDHGHRRLAKPVDLGTTPLDHPLPEGSYVISLSAAGRASARYPILLEAGENRSVEVALPPSAHIPAGYIYVAAGRFLFGSGDEEVLRVALVAQPMHPVETAAYLIGRDEVTFADWIEFLTDLSDRERAAHMPGVGTKHGALEMVGPPRGGWQITLQPTTARYQARWGEPIKYGARDLRQVQDWRRFPVSAVSLDDARAYLSWLDRSGRLRGARLCDEREWERAARGADDRLYTTGDRLSPDDANFDQTYSRDPLGFGPDQVGSHPASDSPFGVRDLQGNAMEMAYSVRPSEESVVRGGSWYHDLLTGRLTNRAALERSTRTIQIGLRVCANLASSP
jgi:eukaryotic-like serine/threonine-protein kinase